MRLAFTALLAGFCVSAQASECLQGNAIYTDADKVYELRFSGTGDEGRGLATNLFTFRLKGGEPFLVGSASWNNGIARPNGTLRYNCPAGDITGAELDECQIWRGVVYSVHPDGSVDLLPPDTDPAAFGLLLPDFGRRLRYSKSWADKKLDVVPWDHFTYIGCTE